MSARKYIVGRAEAGRTVADWLRARLALPIGDVHRLIRGRCVYVGGAPCSDPGHRLRSGQRLEVRPPSKAAEKETLRKPPGAYAPGSPGPQPVIVHADEQIVVVDKPPGLTTMRHADEAAEFGRGAAVPAADVGGSAARFVGEGQVRTAGTRPRRPPP